MALSANVEPEDTLPSHNRIEFVIVQDWDNGSVDITAYLNGEGYDYSLDSTEVDITSIKVGTYEMFGDRRAAEVYFVESGDGDAWDHDKYKRLLQRWKADVCMSAKVREHLERVACEFHDYANCGDCKSERNA